MLACVWLAKLLSENTPSAVAGHGLPPASFGLVEGNRPGESIPSCWKELFFCWKVADMVSKLSPVAITTMELGGRLYERGCFI